MANYPKKMMDPTEAALSAIQEALNIRDNEAAATPETQPQPEARSEGRPEGMADLFGGAPALLLGIEDPVRDVRQAELGALGEQLRRGGACRVSGLGGWPLTLMPSPVSTRASSCTSCCV